MLSNSKLDMKLLLNNVSFFSCHLDLHSIADQKQLLEDVNTYMSENSISPVETQCFSSNQIKNALNLMLNSKHFGKICISIENDKALAMDSLPASPFSDNYSYLFTGMLN
jgi:NADPH:quinone reductase-like Zn-dependent oxidoreductase